jgi:starch-binding outer membrane protein, SusD/RagB family
MKRLPLLVAAPLLLAIASCGDLVGLTPPSEIVVDDLYRTEDDFNQAVLGTYAALRGQYTGWWEIGDLRADDVWQQQLNQTGRVLTDTYAGHTAADGVWNNGYTTIHRANVILEQLERVNIDDRARYAAEAKFLRALTYFNIVRIFGDAPLVTSPVLPEQAYQIGRTNVSTIYDELIIPGLTEAANVLPDRYSGVSVGRATRGAARALLGRVYLTRGDFANAEASLLDVTAMGYSLLADFNALYDWTRNKHHSEYIFDIEYSSDPGVPGSVWSNIFAPNWDVYRNHFNIGGLLHDSFTPTREFYDLFEEGDLRKAITVADGITTNDGVFHPIPARLQSLFTLKYAIAVNSNNNSDGNWIVIRYADVLLMLAEAMNENGKTGEAHTYLNAVRERADLNPHIGLTAAELRDAIQVERRLELHGEGHRWFDLIRWGRATEVLGPLGMQPYMNVWPIPQAEVDLINDPRILPQNPGYVGGG